MCQVFVVLISGDTTELGEESTEAGIGMTCSPEICTLGDNYPASQQIESMQRAKRIFHYISYLQYPLLLIAIYYVYKPLLFEKETIWADYNKALLFLGLGISFSTLQDTTKTQNKLSLWIWVNPRRSKIFLIYLGAMTLAVIMFGLYGLIWVENGKINELSLGTICLGIGLISVLKGAIEMAEFHQKDIPS